MLDNRHPSAKPRMNTRSAVLKPVHDHHEREGRHAVEGHPAHGAIVGNEVHRAISDARHVAVRQVT